MTICQAGVSLVVGGSVRITKALIFGSLLNPFLPKLIQKISCSLMFQKWNTGQKWVKLITATAAESDRIFKKMFTYNASKTITAIHGNNVNQVVQDVISNERGNEFCLKRSCTAASAGV
jgi:hypothetical protein